ncbi:MAG: tetratricopeptide repeat protein, partial [Dolichospermum sp.]
CTFSLSLQAWIYTKQQQWRPAVRAATQAVFRLKQTPLSNSKESQLWIYPYLIIALEKAVITQQANDVERRIQEFIAQVPDSSIAWGLMGWKKAKYGLWDDAFTNFEQASRKAQVPSWILINYGITQEHLQNIPGAIQVYEVHNQKLP